MDYEKKYKEALERAREKRDEYKRLDGEESFVPSDIEYIFPELKESEDEKMRAMAIKAVYAPEAQSCIRSCGIDPDYVIAWLEKQGQTFTKKDVDDAYLKGVCDARHEFEKQSEQKPAWSEEDSE